MKSQSRIIETSGDIIQIALPSTAFISTLIWKDGTKPTWQFAKAFGVSFLTTHALKRIIDKQRPSGGNFSFPSGHTSAAFTGAAFIEKRYGWEVGIPAYLLAGYVGWSRVHANKHDYWDVLGGIIVGIGSSYLFTKPYQKNKIEIGFQKVRDEGYVLGVTYTF